VRRIAPNATVNYRCSPRGFSAQGGRRLGAPTGVHADVDGDAAGRALSEAPFLKSDEAIEFDIRQDASPSAATAYFAALVRNPAEFEAAVHAELDSLGLPFGDGFHTSLPSSASIRESLAVQTQVVDVNGELISGGDLRALLASVAAVRAATALGIPTSSLPAEYLNLTLPSPPPPDAAVPLGPVLGASVGGIVLLCLAYFLWRQHVAHRVHAVRTAAGKAVVDAAVSAEASVLRGRRGTKTSGLEEASTLAGVAGKRKASTGLVASKTKAAGGYGETEFFASTTPLPPPSSSPTRKVSLQAARV